jgi:glycosyltransferase involved in cell wall biosynthesis
VAADSVAALGQVPNGAIAMRSGHKIGVVIPALNEARAIGSVIGAIPDWVDRIVVADNGSTDDTGAVAAAAGAVVVREEEAGYGAACLRGIREVADMDVVVFVDGDFSDHPEDMADLADPIIAGTADMVIGSRSLGDRERGSLTPQQIFGNWLATRLIRLIWGARYTDLGPFRAIRRTSLARLGMADRNYGWTVEMQIRAAEAGLATAEVPVRYRRRIGVSKVSGTIKGTVMAGTKILLIIARHAARRHRLTRKDTY